MRRAKLSKPLSDSPYQPPCGFCNCSMIWSTLKLDGFWRGGNSLKVSTKFADQGLRRHDEE